jgi:glycosyltransferase involved in cell wall biosynthesis
MNSSLRIGIDARVLGRRGVGRYLKNLCQAMAGLKHGHSITLFLGPRSERQAVPSGPGFQTFDLPSGHPAWLEQTTIPGLARRLGLDLLHFPDNTGPLFCKVPYVLTLHDALWLRPLAQSVSRPTFSQRLQDFYRKRVSPAAATRARLVLTDSGYSRRGLQSALGLSESKVRTILLAADPVFGKKTRPALANETLKRLGISGRFLVAQGASDRRKNTDRLIEAFGLGRRRSKLLASCSLVITSLRPGELETTSYLDTARRAGVEKALCFTGYVSEMELAVLYQKALGLAFPSLAEGFGLPVLEAFASGCPVLTSGTTSIPEVAGQAALQVDPESVEAIAAGLVKLVQPGVASRLKAAGARQVKKFSWRRTAEETLKAWGEAA